MTITRRDFGKLVAGTTLGALSAPALSGSHGSAKHVVVIGGGTGGASAARYIRYFSQGKINVTIIEPVASYFTCYFSNLYLGGLLDDMNKTRHTYDTLKSAYGVKVIQDRAGEIDKKAMSVTLHSGEKVAYDALVVSPGIDFKYNALPGFSEAAAQKAPHAYRGGEDIVKLKQMLLSMREGGTFILVAPPNPYRCPPGPYERVSMAARLLKEHNPSAKIIILDPKQRFSKQGLFRQAWEAYYPGMIEWISPDVHQQIVNIDVEAGAIETGFDTFKGDVISVIPPQSAGQVALDNGLTNDTGWCPVSVGTMQSTLDEHIYVIGDSSIASSMPKSGFAANSQAKVCAAALVSEMNDTPQPEPWFANTCWSIVAENDGIKVGAVYRAADKKIEKSEGFISSLEDSAKTRKANYHEAMDWYRAFTLDIFG